LIWIPTEPDFQLFAFVNQFLQQNNDVEQSVSPARRNQQCNGQCCHSVVTEKC